MFLYVITLYLHSTLFFTHFFSLVHLQKTKFLFEPCHCSIGLLGFLSPGLNLSPWLVECTMRMACLAVDYFFLLAFGVCMCLMFVLFQAAVCSHLETTLDAVNWVIGKAKLSYAAPEGTCTSLPSFPPPPTPSFI